MRLDHLLSRESLDSVPVQTRVASDLEVNVDLAFSTGSLLWEIVSRVLRTHNFRAAGSHCSVLKDHLRGFFRSQLSFISRITRDGWDRCA